MCKAALWHLPAIALGATLLLALPLPSQAQQDGQNASEALLFAEEMEKSLVTGLSNHQAELAELKKQLSRLETMQGTIRNEIAAHNSQNTAHSQLLLVPNITIEDLEIAFASNRQSVKRLAEGIKTMQQRCESTGVLSQQTDDVHKLAFNRTVQDVAIGIFVADVDTWERYPLK